MAQDEGYAIGIDLGTKYSCVAVWKNDNVEIIVNDQGNRTTPSCVAYANCAELLVGEAALNQAVRNPENTIFDAKRLIGRKFSDRCVQADKKLWPFKVVGDLDDQPMISVSHNGKLKQSSPEMISSIILGKMRDIAENYVGSTVKNAVITVPAYFNNAQRLSTKKAATDAGLNVMRMINEPTAAAIAYGLENNAGWNNCKRNVVVFDLGGGTLDASLLAICDGAFEVKATAGDTHLGGEDFDSKMVSFCVEEFERMHKIDVTGDIKALRRLRNACEQAKRSLSFTTKTDTEIECFHKGIDFDVKFSRAKFEQLNMEFFNKCVQTVEKCLEDAKMDVGDVHDVVLAGGSSRIPKVQEMLQNVFKGKELCKSINPDEAIAYGAAVQAAVLTGRNNMKLENFILRDVTPLSLGILVDIGSVKNIMSFVIRRNTEVPIKKNRTYVNNENQTCVVFFIYEGESERALENHLLGKFSINGIAPAPAYTIKFDVCFSIDANGILNVTAEEISTGRKNGIMINLDTKTGMNCADAAVRKGKIASS